MIVDSHQHFWDLERVEYSWLVPAYGPIYRSFHPAELEPQLRARGWTGPCWSSRRTRSRTRTRCSPRRAEHDWIGAVVGWVPLEDARRPHARWTTGYLLHPKFRACGTSTTTSRTRTG